MLSFLYVYSDHSILECYNLFSGVELSMRSFFVISVDYGIKNNWFWSSVSFGFSYFYSVCYKELLKILKAKMRKLTKIL